MSTLNDHPLILKYIELNRFGQLLGMDFSIVEPGHVEYRLRVEEQHLATPHAAHGGVIAALLDATVGVGALSSVCTEHKVVSTVEMKTTFLGPAFLGDELTSVSRQLRKGNRLIFMEADLFNQNKELIARASSTLNAYPKEKAGY